VTREYEFYETPRGLTEALLDSGLVILTSYDRVLDPCCGEWAILDAVKDYYNADGKTIHPWGNDINQEMARADLNEDVTTDLGWRKMIGLTGRPNWVICNPPFSKAHHVIPHALDYALDGVAMLLPLRFIEPAKGREKVLRESPWTAQLTFGQPRPSFTDDGRTDSVTTFWAVWDKHEYPMSLFYATLGLNKWQSFKS
jgi:hypothetical protein